MKHLILIVIIIIVTNNYSYLQNSENFEGIIKYKISDPKSFKIDTAIHYIKNDYSRINFKNKNGRIKDIYCNLTDLPNKTTIFFNDKTMDPLVSISSTNEPKYIITDDTIINKSILGLPLKCISVKYDKKYDSNDLFYTQIEYKIYYSDEIAFTPPSTYKTFDNILSNGSGKIALIVEIFSYSDAPRAPNNKYGPTRIEAYSILHEEIPNEIIRIPGEIK